MLLLQSIGLIAINLSLFFCKKFNFAQVFFLSVLFSHFRFPSLLTVQPQLIVLNIC